MGAKNFLSAASWRERILHFEPSWFTIAMSTGTLQQCFVNFPYPYTGGRPWLRDIGYCLWILEIVVFCSFLLMILGRYLWHPSLFKKNILEFPNSSFLGAIPISLNTIIIGIMSYYNYRTSARWATFVLWWIALVLALLVSIGIMTVQTMRSKQQSLSDVAGLWIMSVVPLFTTASSGATMLPYLNVESTKCAVIVLVISFMCWSLGVAEVNFILGIYFFRLISNNLPAKPLLASGFLPLAALGQGAYAILQLSIYLATYIKSTGYGPTQVSPPPIPTTTLQATSEVIHWIGIIVCLFLLAHSTFWLVQAVSSILYARPKEFNIAMWSFVFPWASYANAWAVLSRDLRNDGMRGWAAFNIMVVTLIWLFCTVMTTWLGVIKGELFNAPGLEEWVGEEEKQQTKGKRGKWNGTYQMDGPGSIDEEKGDAGEDGEQQQDGDGQQNGARRRNN